MSFQFPIEAGHIMLFARAIGDPNPVYSDPDAASASGVGGIIAPPTFVQCSAQWDPDWHLRPTPGERWVGSGREATGVTRDGAPSGVDPARGLLAEQRFEYHRPVRPGDVLTVVVSPGKTWEKDGRSGKLVFAERVTEYRDEAGELVVTAWSVAVRTEGAVVESMKGVSEQELEG